MFHTVGSRVLPGLRGARGSRGPQSVLTATGFSVANSTALDVPFVISSDEAGVAIDGVQIFPPWFANSVRANMQSQWATNATGQRYTFLYQMRDGAVLKGRTLRHVSQDAGEATFETDAWPILAGDHLRLNVFQNSGAARLLNASLVLDWGG